LEHHVNRQKLGRPSLKITRQVDQKDSGAFSFEVWNPFTGLYQPVDSVQDGLRRVADLAGLICQMWLQRHPKQSGLTDAPDVGAGNRTEWAEFRINPTTYRSYDTRRHDRPAWMRAVGMIQAVEVTCARVGYALPASGA
jgi:hypothetical protein